MIIEVYIAVVAPAPYISVKVKPTQIQRFYCQYVLFN